MIVQCEQLGKKMNIKRFQQTQELSWHAMQPILSPYEGTFHLPAIQKRMLYVYSRTSSNAQKKRQKMLQ